MTWDGIRDDRLLTNEQLSLTRTTGSDWERKLIAHIDALHHIMGDCHEMLQKTRQDEMTPGNLGWSTVVAAEVLLEEHLPQASEAQS